MKREIERKFRVLKMSRLLRNNGITINQGYFCFEPEVRVRTMGNKGFIAIKTRGHLSRDEYEYEIPFHDAEKLLKMCRWRVSKTRCRMGRFVFDVYKGGLRGLILAEIELERPSQKIELPKGVECFEVTYNPRYKHRYLLQATAQDIATLLAQRRRTSR